MDAKDQMFQMVIVDNMNWIVRFHNHMNVSLNQFRKELPTWSEVNDSDKKFWKHVYENEFPKKLRQTCFLLMFGHLEEMLILLRQQDNDTKIELDRGFGLTKYKPHIKQCLGTDFEKSKEFSFIATAQDIRNCLLHSAGRISMMKEKEKLKRIIKTSKGLYVANTDRIQISAEALLMLQNSITGLLLTMHNAIVKKKENA